MSIIEAIKNGARFRHNHYTTPIIDFHIFDKVSIVTVLFGSGAIVNYSFKDFEREFWLI